MDDKKAAQKGDKWWTATITKWEILVLSLCSFILGTMTADKFIDFRRILTGYAYLQGMYCQYITDEPYTWFCFMAFYVLGVLLREIVMVAIF